MNDELNRTQLIIELLALFNFDRDAPLEREIDLLLDDYDAALRKVIETQGQLLISQKNKIELLLKRVSTLSVIKENSIPAEGRVKELEAEGWRFSRQWVASGKRVIMLSADKDGRRFNLFTDEFDGDEQLTLITLIEKALNARIE